MKVFKNFIFIFFLITFLILFSYSEVDIKKSRSLERSLSDEIELILSRILERKTFVVSVTAEVDKKVVREIKNQEDNTHTVEPIIISNNNPVNSSPQDKNLEENLEDEFGNLGFPEIDEQPKKEVPKENNSTPQVTEKVTTSGSYITYNYRNVYEVLAVNVAIIFDQNIPTETRQSLQNLISRNITAKYKDKGSVEFSVSDLKNKYPKEIIDYIKDYIVLFYIALGLIIFFIILMLVLFLMRVLLSAPQRRERRNSYSNRPIVVRPKEIPKRKENFIPRREQRELPRENPPENSPRFIPKEEPQIEQQEESETEEILYDGFMQKENEFIQIFLRDPLISRKYFVSLQQSEQEKMLSAITAENIKKIFQTINPQLSLTKDIFQDDNDKRKEIKDKIKFFEKSTKDLKQFRKFIELQNYGHFGSLSLLNKNEINDILDGIDLKQLALIMKNIDKEIIEFYIKQLSDDKKRELIKIISDKQDISQQEIEEVSKIL